MQRRAPQRDSAEYFRRSGWIGFIEKSQNLKKMFVRRAPAPAQLSEPWLVMTRNVLQSYISCPKSIPSCRLRQEARRDRNLLPLGRRGKLIQTGLQIAERIKEGEIFKITHTHTWTHWYIFAHPGTFFLVRTLVGIILNSATYPNHGNWHPNLNLNPILIPTLKPHQWSCEGQMKYSHFQKNVLTCLVK